MERQREYLLNAIENMKDKRKMTQLYSFLIGLERVRENKATKTTEK